jgi:isopentenyldiphosphate isomerase
MTALPLCRFAANSSSKAGVPRVGFVFLCQVEDADPIPQHDEVRDIRWMTVPELRQIVEETPERIFTLQLSMLEYYFQHASSHP